MKYTVINHDLSVGSIQITAVASSAIFIIGDSKVISPSSIFDTPPESLTVGPLVPLAEE